MSGDGKARIESLLERGGEEGAGRLSEHDSLRVLELWGVEVVLRRLARTASEATAAAEELGCPVVVKGIVPGIAHKTEKGLVHPFVRSEDEVREAVGRLPEECTGYLVEEHVEGVRELVMGVVRDPTFGASVLVGMGGVHSELLDDTAFVTAPVGGREARAALDRLRCRPMLGRYRGEEPADIDRIVRMMQELGKLAMAFPRIRELDVNPVIIRRSGAPVAASGLIVCSP